MPLFYGQLLEIEHRVGKVFKVVWIFQITSTITFAFSNMEMPDVHDLVQSVANKQQQNKRKRDPDMYLDAVLECTVRKLNRERMEKDEALRKRQRIDTSDRGSYCASTNASLSGKISDASRTLNDDSLVCKNNDCDIDTSFANLDDELSGDLKELLDELSREFPCDFWLTDSNNNAPVETRDANDGDMWLSSFIEVLCST